MKFFVSIIIALNSLLFFTSTNSQFANFGLIIETYKENPARFYQLYNNKLSDGNANVVDIRGPFKSFGVRTYFEVYLASGLSRIVCKKVNVDSAALLNNNDIINFRGVIKNVSTDGLVLENCRFTIIESEKIKSNDIAYVKSLEAHFRRNMIFDEPIEGNPRVEYELRIGPDGTILNTQLRKSSGFPQWDGAVLRAIELTGSVPLNESESVPRRMVLGFRPKD
jgi:hypothetical protein